MVQVVILDTLRVSFLLCKDALPYFVSFVVIYWSTVTWTRKSRLASRRAQYDVWIRNARLERDEKVHAALLEGCDNDDGEKESMLTAIEIRDRIHSMRQDPRSIVVGLSKRCHKYGRENCCNVVTEEFYDLACASAKELVEKAIPFPTPKLLGVPISVKECLAMKGTYSTGGLACRLRRRDENDSLIVQVLRSAGAIPLCSGNVTQFMMLAESVNRIWGRSKNPWDLTRTPGGSSGGDAALVAMGCVPVAVASDVAGSIRIPASFCGVIGFKPTSNRVSTKGCMKPRFNDRSGTSILIPTSIGPIARSVDDCALFMKAVLVEEMFRNDSSVPPLPFNADTYESNEKLRIGYFDTDGWFEPCATSRRAIRMTIEKLRERGHDCEPFRPPTDGWESYGLLVGINAAEGNFKSFIDSLEGEQLIPEYSILLNAANLPHWLRWLIIRVIDRRRGHLLKQSRSGGISVPELWQRTADLADMRKKWADALLEQKLDALIFPAMPLPPFLHGISGKITAACSYVFLANMLLWPSGTVPVTTIGRDEEHYDLKDLPASQRDAISKIAANIMKGSAGLPISVSIMSPSYSDETCLRLMREVEAVSNFKGKPSAFRNT